VVLDEWVVGNTLTRPGDPISLICLIGPIELIVLVEPFRVVGVRCASGIPNALNAGLQFTKQTIPHLPQLNRQDLASRQT
jgi:hypothetical protein